MENLKNLRRQQGKTQKEIADAIGIAHQTYSHYEVGRSQPDFETLIKLAEYFNVSTDYLLGNKPNYYPDDLYLEEDEYLMIGSDGKKERKKMTPELKAYIDFLDKRENKPPPKT